MKAIIMAGGEGRRLRPVSGERPKPMVPFLGRPMMEHIILLLKEQGFDDICVTLRYKAEDIINYFGSGSSLGVKLRYKLEDKPLGTAGSVKNCKDFYGDEEFLVISGDAACDFALSELMEQHKKRNSIATLALYKNSEPLSFGLAVTDENDLIRCFVEKPDWSRVVTDLVNTGIYVLSPAAMDFVPEDSAFDFGKELFPLLLEQGKKLTGIELKGYWCDVGSPLSYYKCCVDALEGRLRLNIPSEFYAATPASAPTAKGQGISMDLSCKNRAGLMAALSQISLDLGAEYKNGLSIRKPHYTLHIAPLSNASAVRLSVQSADTEFASSLALSTKELIEALDL